MNLKNTIFGLLFLWLAIPFVLVYNFFPFFRYGMFAETFSKKNSTEVWKIYYLEQGKAPQQFHSTTIQWNEGHFSYVLRNYIYKQKSTQLLKNLHQIYGKNKKIIRWDLYQLILEKPTQRKDSIHLATWRVYSE